MDNLIIVSDNELSGLALGSRLGLSSSSCTILTSSADIDSIPDGSLYIHDDKHPEDSVIIGTKLNLKKCKNLVDESTLGRYLDGIITLLNYYNSLYSSVYDVDTIKKGISKLGNDLTSFGLTESQGFRYIVMYNQSGSYFYLVPESPLMELMVQLLKTRILMNKSKMSKTALGFEINDPKGIFSKNSIKYDWQ